MKKTAILFLLFTLSTMLFAHNYLIEQDNNGLNLQMSAYKYYSNYMVNSSFGYTLKGRLTLNTNFSNVFYGQSDTDLYTSYGTDLSYLILKQKHGIIPINLSLNTSYNFLINNVGLSYDNSILSKSHIVGIGASISHEFIFDESLSLIPLAGIKYENENISYLHLPEEGYWGSWPINNNTLIYSFNGFFVFKNIYAFCRIEYISNVSWEDIFSLYYKTTHIGLGIILSCLTSAKSGQFEAKN